MNRPIPEETLATIKDCLVRGKKIEAIKLYRDCTAVALADAKTAVEQLEAELRAASPQQFTSPARRQGDASVQTRRLGRWAFLVFGIVFLLWGLGMGVSSLSFSFGSAHTEGTVVKLEENALDEPPHALYPVVQYHVDDSKYSYTGVGSYPARYTVGQKVRILYKVEQPEVASIDSFFDRWLVPVVVTGVGALFVGIGALIVWQGRPRTA
jgi:hypothetical protein